MILISRLKNTLLVLALCLVLSSCFKEKALKQPVHSSSETTGQINLGPNYTDQLFYSLETNQVLSSNSRFAYDLMFDCSPNTFHIWLNTAKFMCALNTNKTDFGSATMNDTVGQNWVYERGSYNTDSSAMGNWYTSLSSQPVSANNVYLINLGVDSNGNNLGFAKMQVHNFFGNSYSISFACFTSPDSGSLLVPKDSSRNYRYLAFSGTGNILNTIEPDKNTWDLCFTHYSVILYAPYYLPYQVTGVLSNPSRVKAYVDSTVVPKNLNANFDSARLSDFNVSLLQSNRDAIGYDWKTWTGTYYTTKSYYVFFIQVNGNIFYKFHFVTFNNNSGVKGYPLFEYQQF